MITKLTASQLEHLSEIRNHWLSVGLCTERISIDRARKICADFYFQLWGKKEERPIIVLDSQLGCWLGVLMVRRQQVEQQVRQQVCQQVWQQVKEQVREQVRQQVGEQVREQVGEQVWQQVREQVRLQVEQQVGEQVEQQVEQQVRQQVCQQVWQQVKEQVWAFIWPYVDGHFFASYFAWVEAMRFIGVKGIEGDKYEAWKATTELGLYYPLENFVIVGSRPTSICRDGQNNLHADGKAALEYADGYKLYSLHGITVPEKYVLMPAERINPQEVLKEPNADIRRELLRKVGIERMLSVLPHKKLDEKGNYQLISIRLSEQVTDARYLKMLNPSIGVWHLEGVAPECDTVEKSLNWRNQNMFTNADVLT